MKAQFLVMHDYANRDWSAEKPAWGPVGAWMWWGWDELYPDPAAKIEPYLQRAAELGKPIALSVMLYPDLNRDCTPAGVYRQIGRSAGWTVSNDSGPLISCPAWGDPAWEREYFALIAQIAAKYDGDPRVHSVWICTGVYGETIFAKNGYSLLVHYARQFTTRCIERYPQMFTRTPVFILLSTGDRAYYVNECIKRGVGVKMNTLLPDPPNGFAADGNGQTEAAITARAAGLPLAFEHAYAANANDTYWAMLYAATMGATTIDLPVGHLDALAALPAPDGGVFWDFVLRWLDPAWGAFWIARDTAYPDAGGWEHGLAGPFTRRMAWKAGNIEFFARNGALPVELRDYISAYGAGWIEDAIVLRHEPLQGAQRVRVTAIAESGVALEYNGRVIASAGTGWQMLRIDAPQLAEGDVILRGPGHVHSVWVEPLADEPPPPPPPPIEPPSGSDGLLARIVALLRAVCAWIKKKLQEA